MSVASKNFFDLLGNDDGDSETPSGPVKTVDKTAARAGKRNEPEPQSKPAPIVNRRGNFGGPDAAFRDRGAGGDRNRGKATEDAPRGGARGGGYGARVRGGRGSRYPRERDDRHSRGLPGGGSDKQAAQSSATEGQAELKDEQAGEEIAQTEQKEAIAEGEGLEGDKAEKPEEPAEPEDKHISYTDYLAQLAEKKLALEASVSVRKPNEGSKLDKKWASAKPLVKEEDEDFISGSGGKAKRERERKKKELVEIDNRYIEPDRRPPGGGRGGRGGRGGGRGDHARGDHRGGPRGGGGGGFRGGRGGREAGGPSINPADQSAFPSLGG